jgi:hypothetical protein
MPGLLPSTTTGPNLNSKEELLKAGEYVGKLPSTGVIHRLTIHQKDGKLLIERHPYRSPNADGWTQHYETLRGEDPARHLHLISQIRSNPCEWD